jgi:hypothetical protein
MSLSMTQDFGVVAARQSKSSVYRTQSVLRRLIEAANEGIR